MCKGSVLASEKRVMESEGSCFQEWGVSVQVHAGRVMESVVRGTTQCGERGVVRGGREGDGLSGERGRRW